MIEIKLAGGKEVSLSMQGWIKLHRSLQEKALWTEATAEQIVILMTLLMMANHKEKEWEWKGEKYVAKPGQFVTSLPQIAKKAGHGITIQKVRTALARFEKYEFLTGKSTNRNRLITIVNWAQYQGSETETEIDLTGKNEGTQQAANRQITANKNVRKKEEVIKDLSSMKFSFHDMENARLLFELMLANNPGIKKPNFEKWADEFRLIRERDKRPDEAVKYLIRWTQNDSFWKTVILSPGKFRKQYDRLVLVAKEAHEQKKFAKVVPMEKRPPTKAEFEALREKLQLEEN